MVFKGNMANRSSDNNKSVLYFVLTGLIFLSVSCNSTRRLKEGEALLWKNKVVLRSDKAVANRGERKDNLYKIIAQRPNTDALDLLPFRTPFKLIRYNHRYRKLYNRPDSLLPKSVERPVVLDTTLMPRTMQNMKSYLFNQGYFYAAIKDSVIIEKKKATVRYFVDLGDNYLINRINYDIDDSLVLGIVRADSAVSILQSEKEFSFSMLEEERSRLTTLLRDNGYFRFTQDNIAFVIDTFDKTIFKNAESPFESAINFIKLNKPNTKQTIDISVVIRLADDTNAYKKYTVGNVNVFPDYYSANDLKDSTLRTDYIDSVAFKYHNKYVHSNVLYRHIFLSPDDLYSQSNFNKTYTKLNELGIFQFVRIDVRENRRNRGTVDYNVLLNKTKKYDFSAGYEISRGSTYALGNSINVNARDRNFMHGANLLTIGVNGGIELAYDKNSPKDVLERYSLLTRYYGVNASIDFPKFLAPVASSLFDNSNLPHTIIGGGENVMDRVLYFKLINTSTNFSYNWRQTNTTTWNFSPVFVNIIRLPLKTDSFIKVLRNNEYLRNSYQENTIEGESISYTFDNNGKKHGVNYSYLRLGLEEAGLLLSGINQVGKALNNLYNISFYQYVKFDFDARHFFTLPHSTVALHFYGGIGIPYDKSDVLPYIKQYYAGGPYSLRGWQIRTLGPGSYIDTTTKTTYNQIDRTGDVKLEFNGEYRFPVTTLFAGNVKMNGALFFDAGNIWLTKANSNYPDGEFRLNKLAQDIAADVGIGSRFDIASFLTIRVELGVPVKKPYVLTNNGWVFDKIDFGNKSWRSQNMVGIFTIGYPF